MKHIFLGLLFFFVQIGDEEYLTAKNLTPRYFNELREYKIQALSKIDTSHVLALTNNGKILEWRGVEWREFHTQPPTKEGLYFYAHNAQNIWLFYKKEPFYHTKAMHYNGSMWRHITLSQPYTIITLSFISPQKFWAGGAWGSLIFFDGQQSHNIPCPVAENVSQVIGLSEHSALLVIGRDNMNRNRDAIYHINRRGSARKLLSAPSLRLFTVTTADSFVFVRNKKQICAYHNGRTLVLDTLENLPNNVDVSLYNNYDKFKSFFESFNGKDHEIDKIVQIADDEYFIIMAEGKLAYYGKKLTGTENSPYQRLFVRAQLINQNYSHHLSASAYRANNDQLEIYFTSPEVENRQIKTDKLGRGSIENVIHKRNLTGYALTRNAENQLWDGSMQFADLDNDRDLDGILSALRGYTRFFENKGHDRFEEVSGLYGINISGRIQEVSVGDLNNDGWLDIVAGNEIGPLRIFKNGGHWRFTDITSSVGLDSLEGYKTALADMNNDGYVDLFLFGNYGAIRYFQNSGKKGAFSFLEKSALSPDLTSCKTLYTRSFCFFDYDIDGDLDFIIVNRNTPTRLFENTDGNRFVDVSAEKGFNQSFLGYGAACGDYNMDGWQDIFLTTHGKNYLYWNHQGKNFEIDSTVIPNNKRAYSTACIAQDLNYDGAVDIIVANYLDGASHILYNQAKSPGAIRIQVNDRMNTNGLGAHVALYKAGHLGEPGFLKGYQEIRHQNGYCSGVLPEAVFYLPDDVQCDVAVHFPSGKKAYKLNISKGNNILIEAPASMAENVKFCLMQVASIMLNQNKRLQTISILFFLIMILVTLYVISQYTIWQRHHLLFYLVLITVSFISLKLYFESFSFWYALTFPIYIIVIFAVISFLAINHYIKLQYREDYQFELFDLVRQFNHSRAGMNVIDHLIFLSKNFDKNNFTEELEKERLLFKQSSLPMLKRIAVLGKKLIYDKYPGNDYSKILAKIEKITLNKQLKNNSAEMVLYLNQIKKPLDRIRDNINAHFSSDLLQCINQTLKHFPAIGNVTITNKSGLDEPFVLIRKDHLLQVLGNLFQNACDAMDSRSQKRISIKIFRDNNDFIIFQLRDFGGGLPEGHKRRIFEEHYSTKGSSGLGLYHAKKLLNRYGSKISAPDKQPGQGALFEIKFKKVNYHETENSDDR